MDSQDTKDGWTKLDKSWFTLKNGIAVFNHIFSYNERERDRKQELLFPTTLETTPVIPTRVKDQAKSFNLIFEKIPMHWKRYQEISVKITK